MWYLYLHLQHFRKPKDPLWKSTHILMSKLCRNITIQKLVKVHTCEDSVVKHMSSCADSKSCLRGSDKRTNQRDRRRKNQSRKTLPDHLGSSHDFLCNQCCITNIAMDIVHWTSTSLIHILMHQPNQISLHASYV